MSDAEKEFELFVAMNLDEAESLLSCTFTGLRKLVRERGAVGAARHLLAPENVARHHMGFSRLIAADLLHLSLEGAVLRFKDRGLFAKSVIAAAHLRIVMAQNIRLQSGKRA